MTKEQINSGRSNSQSVINKRDWHLSDPNMNTQYDKESREKASSFKSPYGHSDKSPPRSKNNR